MVVGADGETGVAAATDVATATDVAAATGEAAVGAAADAAPGKYKSYHSPEILRLQGCVDKVAY